MGKSIWKALYDTPYTTQTAVSLGGKSLTYSNLKKSAMLFCDKLHSIGIKKGDVVTIALPNTIESIIAFYGINAKGAIANMVHPSLPNYNLKLIQEDTHSKLLVGLPHHVATTRKITCMTTESDVTGWDNFMKTPSSPSIYEDSDRVSVYLHSGGTTDKPKTIVLSSSNFNSLANDLAKLFYDGECVGYKSLTILPTFHGFGLGAGIHTLLMLGAELVLVPKFDKLQTPDLIVDKKINMVLGVPSVFSSILASKKIQESQDLSFVKHCFVGGDSASPTLLSDFNSLLSSKRSDCKLCQGYGLTECVSVVTVNSRQNYRIGSVGKPLSTIDIGIDCGGKFAPANTIGEICVSGNIVMKRYLNGTKKTFTSSDGKVWLKTGDYGYLDQDGYCYFVDRKKRIAKVSGVTVFPKEVEKLLSSYHGIRDCFVKQGKNKKLVAYVVKTPESNLNEKIIIDYLKSHLMKWAVPERVVFLDYFPTTTIGKIDINNEIFD